MNSLKKVCLVILGLSLNACVSINTVPNSGSQRAQVPDPIEQTEAETKVSLKDAANYNMSLGAQYVSRGNIAKGIEKLEKAITQDPSLALAYSYLGFAYEKLDDAPKADQNYLKAIKLDPSNPVSANNYGTFLCRQNDLAKSLLYFEKAVNNRKYQTPEAAYANAGTCARKIPNNAKAKEYFVKVLQYQPRSQEALWNLADISIEMNELEDAKTYYKAFNQVLPKDKPNADKLLLAYRLAKASGDNSSANVYALQLREKFPRSEQAKKL